MSMTGNRLGICVALTLLTGCGREPGNESPAGTPAPRGPTFAYVTRSELDLPTDPNVGAVWKLVLSAYKVDDATGAWSLVGSVLDLAPLTLDARGRFLLAGLYDRNSAYHGIPNQQTQIATYGIDPSTGALSLTSTKSAFHMNGPVALHPSLPFVVLSNSDHCFYRVMAFDPATGTIGDTLSELIPCGGRGELANPYSSVAADPRGRFVYYSDCNPSGPMLPGQPVRPSVSGYRLNVDTGSMQWTGEWAAGHCIAIDPSARHLYSSIPDGRLAEFAIDDTTGSLSLMAEAPSLGTPGPLVVHPSGRFLYLASGSDIVAYRLDASVGAPSLVRVVAAGVAEPSFFTGDASHASFAFPTCRLAMDPAGRYLYIMRTHVDLYGYATTDVLGYSVNSTTGDLRPIPQAEGGSLGTVAARPAAHGAWIGLAIAAP